MFLVVITTHVYLPDPRTPIHFTPDETSFNSTSFSFITQSGTD